MTTSVALSSNPLPCRRSTPPSKEIDDESIFTEDEEGEELFQHEYTGNAKLVGEAGGTINDP
jgi:hypothetical protein